MAVVISRRPHALIPAGLIAVGLIAVGLALLLAGCSGVSSPDAGSQLPFGGMGATAGGVQDMQLARELIAAGRVPPPEAFTVEGMFSEHDLPLAGDPPDRPLTLRGAAGVAPDLAATPHGWLQVGLASNVDPEAFERPSLSFVACVDVSGSMGWAYGGEGYEYETPGSVARGLLAELTARLDGDDRCAIVTYGTDVAVPLPPVAGDHPAVADAVAGLSSGGATNMEAGLQRAFAIAAEEQAAGTEAVRVFLFTDVQPNVGVTSPGSFRELAGTAAETGVGLTLFGLGVGLGQEVLAAITDLRGGNAFSLFATEDAGDLLADSWPWLACPLAHGLDLQLTVPAGLEVVGSYGFPGDEPGFSVASVFLSRRRGALLVELRPTGAAFPGGAEVSGVLEYVDLAGEPVREELAWTLQTPDEATDRWFEQPVVGRTVALAMLVDGMRNAAALYGVEREAAIAHLEAVAARIASDVDGLPAPELAAERDLAAALLALMREGAEQGDLYPGG